MHVPDHLINTTAELVAAGSAAAIVAVVATRPGRRSPRTLLSSPERVGSQLATAALVFALQMVNFPVAPGTSGHLLGGALAAALIGPRRALLAVSSVVVAQALVFADGGVAALGVNLWLIAVIPVGIAALVESWCAARSDLRPVTWWSVLGLAAVVAPPASAMAFTVLYATGATGDAPLGEVATAMLWLHALIGLGEAALTLGVLGAVQLIGTRSGQLDTRPVWGAAVLSAVGLSMLASTQPDGLERVALDVGFAVAGDGSILAGSPLADYEWTALDGVAAVSAAGLVGLGATCVVCSALVALSRAGRVS